MELLTHSGTVADRPEITSSVPDAPRLGTLGLYESVRDAAATSLETMQESVAFGTQAGASDRELIDELAVVFDDEHEAKLVLDRAGFPRKQLPSFRTSLSFWSAVMNAARNGVLHGEQQPIIDAAADLRPANRVFERHRGRGDRGNGDPSTPRRLKLVLELKKWLRVTATITLGVGIIYIGYIEEAGYESHKMETIASLDPAPMPTFDRFDDSGTPSLKEPLEEPSAAPARPSPTMDRASPPVESVERGGPPAERAQSKSRPRPSASHGFKPDRAVVSALRDKIQRKCKNNGDTTVRIEGVISSSGFVKALQVTPSRGAGECAKSIVERAQFDPTPGTRLMPRFSVEL